MRRRWWVAAGVAGLALSALYLANASWLARPDGRLTVLAHRGVHQTFSEAGVTDATCTAARIDPPTHGYLENTIPGIRRAFELGADIVEIDVHPTADGQFAVFHDWTLDCRTNGHGVTREHSMAELRMLDAAWGYTADGGRTYPLRGTGVGLIPSLAEVLAAFPGGRFLINIKSDDSAEAERLASQIMTGGQATRVTIYGGARAIARFRSIRTDVRAWSPGQARTCLLRYELTGWAGLTPSECRDAMVFVPQDQAWLVWGFPNRFLQRMHGAGSEAFIGGAITERRSLTGIDDAARVASLPRGWRGGVSTERIDVVGPLLKPGR